MSGLLGSPILETAIGLFFLYLLLSIICSSVQEMLAAWLKLRAKDLERGIANLVCDPAMFQAVMHHPYVAALGNTGAETTMVRILSRFQRTGGMPSYIGSQAFSTAFLDTLIPVTQQAVLTVDDIRKRALDLINYADRVVASVDVDAPLLEASEALARVHDVLRADLDARLVRLPESSAKQALTHTLHNPLSSALLEGLKKALSLPANHPVRRAVVESIEQLVGRELYGWALGLEENNPLRRVIVGSIDGKQRIGRIMLNLIERQVDPDRAAAAVAQLRAILQAQPPGSGRDVLMAALQSAKSLTEVRAQLEMLLPRESSLREPLLKLVQSIEEDVTGLRTRIEAWFDEGMDHVSGLYKRRAKSWIFGIALVIAAIAGADSVRMIGTLYTNPTIRDVLVRQAERTAADGQSPAAPAAVQQISDLSQLFGYNDLPRTALVQDPGPWLPWTAQKLFGLIITAFAMSMGAPFWFDVLQKIVNVRASGSKK